MSNKRHKPIGKQQQRIPTTELLATALERAKAPQEMIDRARAGYYDDFKSPLDFPIIQLARDAKAYGLTDIAIRAVNGDFDGQTWEADEWAKSPDGKQAYKDFGKYLP